MARLSLNKAQLAREMTDLAMYRRFLPSLDLKRQQLIAERKKTESRIAEIEAGIAALQRTLALEPGNADARALLRKARARISGLEED